MAYYTTELRDVLARHGDLWMYGGWPIYDESYRKQLVENIKDYFYFREIGLETDELFIHRYRIKMRINMPKHNAMFRSMNADFDPLATFLMRKSGKDVTRSDIEQLSAFVNESGMDLSQAVDMLRDEKDVNSRSGNRKGSSVNDATTTSRARSINSDFPQTLLSGREDYASSGGDTVGENKTHAENNENVTETAETTNVGTGHNQNITKSKSSGSDKHDGSNTTRGNIEYILGSVTSGRTTDVGTVLENWLRVSKTVEEQIMDDLESLFMGLYSTGDNFAGPYEHQFPGIYYYYY